MKNISISNTTKGKLPRLPFAKMKDSVLGKQYELSLVFVGSTTSRKLNRIYRRKDKPTNILAFPLSKQTGEIIIDPQRARIDAPRFDRSYEKFIGFLFIHALFHLKGFTHSSKMESKERATRKKFGI
jgi:probable rRNA maturation factor